MISIYPTNYQDQFGIENTIIENDGQVLHLKLRGVNFQGKMFDDFSPEGMDKTQSKVFPLHHGFLCSCQFDCEIPITVTIQEHSYITKLQAHIELGDPLPNGGLDRENIQLTLKINENIYQSSPAHGWFDDALLEIQSMLPAEMIMQCCHTCLFSDYSPAGYGTFGCLACFRDFKQEYLSVKNKMDLLNLFKKQIQYVQETDLCPIYKTRIQGTGYRG